MKNKFYYTQDHDNPEIKYLDVIMEGMTYTVAAYRNKVCKMNPQFALHKEAEAFYKQMKEEEK